jgi:hypothetical protein
VLLLRVFAALPVIHPRRSETFGVELHAVMVCHVQFLAQGPANVRPELAKVPLQLIVDFKLD